jgi:hypothetical protein
LPSRRVILMPCQLISPVSGVTSVKPAFADCGFVARLADQRPVLGYRFLRGAVEMIRVKMRDDDQLHAVEDLLDRPRQIHHRVLRTAGKGRQAVLWREIRIDEDGRPAIGKLERRIPDELELHGCPDF